MRPPALEVDATPGPAGERSPLELGLFLMRMNKGREHLADGRLEEAREEIEAAIALRPDDETALNLLGLTLFKLDRRDEAMSIYRRLALAHPESDILHSNLGVLEFKQGRLHDARRRLETALLLNPSNPRPHLYLALIDRQNGDLKSCLEHLDAAGAAELAEKVRAVEPGLGAADADAPLDLATFLLERATHMESDTGAVFTRRANPAGQGGETLDIRFDDGVTVCRDRVAHVIVHRGALRKMPAPLARMIWLGGHATIRLVDHRGRGFFPVRLERGQRLHIPEERLLAFDNGLTAERHGLESLSHLLVGEFAGAVKISGMGVAVIGASSAAQAVRLARGESMLLSPASLVCWSEGIHARPVSPGFMEGVLVRTPEGEGKAIRLEGCGDVLIEDPV